MNRRDFLFATGAVASFAMGLGFLPSSIIANDVRTDVKRGSQPGIKLGLTTYQIGGRWNISELIENLEKARIFGVELRTDQKYKHGVELDLNSEQRSEVKKRFADSPITLVGLASSERFDNIDPAVVDKAVESSKRYLQLCADIGSIGLRVFPNDFHANVPQEKTLDQIADALRRIAPTAADLNQEVCLEAHGSAGLLPKLRQVVEAVNHPKVRIMLNSDFRDTAGEGQKANLALTKDFLAGRMHLHDLLEKRYVVAKYYEVQIAFLKEIGWNGWGLLEISDYPQDRIGRLTQMRERWEELMG